jgi:hypothetical protein
MSYAHGINAAPPWDRRRRVAHGRGERVTNAREYERQMLGEDQRTRQLNGVWRQSNVIRTPRVRPEDVADFARLVVELEMHRAVIRRVTAAEYPMAEVERVMERAIAAERALREREDDVLQFQFRREAVLRHGPVIGDAALSQLFHEYAGPASVRAPGWPGSQPTLFQRLGRISLLMVLLGMLAFVAGVTWDKSGFYGAGLSFCWLGLGTFCFANYAAARSHESNWIIGPAVAAVGTFACFMLALTSVVASLAS